ncbi:DUF4307 domain-containing protein [Amorphoplanes digitatis]|uniref:DUF4307 domain-containing protein n=1 Tax=Actinoplanes digitatis TaxID=1868 RepID=A0A7W7I568_9ACTN|nr:DUF4307 domain-containing protein [Actinoplanes digitatis]MBB4766368.1 hypothetical protein [Actinoplanes digitatis]GID96073.1 hypothetical protein Adi01nite_54850 [Actinoplanes digitatis]
MSETRATTPVFPPGRYGRRRDGRRRLFAPIALALVAAITVGFLAVRLYGRFGDPDYDAQIVGWSDVTDSRITVKFTVRVPAGGSATCGLRARSYDGAEVGRATVTVGAEGSARVIEVAEVVPTTARAAVGEVLRCAAPR